MKKRWDILAPLDTCVDILVDCKEIMPQFGQAEQLVSDYSFELGGSNCIFASQAAKLGMSVAGVGVVGQDTFGAYVEEKLKEAGVDIRYLKKDGAVKTALGVALCRSGGDRAILTYSGSLDVLTGQDITEEMLKGARHLHIGSYFLMKKLQKDYPAVLQRARAEGLTISLDTNWDPEEKWDSGLDRLLPCIDVFLPNEAELLNISGRSGVTEALACMGKQIPVIAVKCGGKGAVGSREGEIFSCSVREQEAVDTVGAGDSFDAGFLYGFLQGFSMEKSLIWGCYCGSRNVRRSGGTKGQPFLADWENDWGKGRQRFEFDIE